MTFESDRRNAVRLGQNFMAYEGECHHCGAIMIQPVLWRNLQRLRYMLAVPLTLSCVYRCEEHNRAVGGIETSDHLTGEAADIVCPAGMKPEDLAAKCRKAGFARVGFYPTRGFVHASIRERKGYSRIWNGEA